MENLVAFNFRDRWSNNRSKTREWDKFLSNFHDSRFLKIDDYSRTVSCDYYLYIFVFFLWNVLERFATRYNLTRKGERSSSNSPSSRQRIRVSIARISRRETFNLHYSLAESLISSESPIKFDRACIPHYLIFRVNSSPDSDWANSLIVPTRRNW